MNALQFAAAGIALSAIFAMLSHSIVVVHRGTGVPNFAAAGIGMFGTYIFYDLWPGHGFPWPVILAFSLACCAAIGLLMHLVVMRRLRKASVATKVIATLGLMTLLMALADQYFAPYGAIRSVAGFIPNTELHLAAGLTVGTDELWLALIALGISALLMAIQRLTRFGLATSAVCENEGIAAGMGWSPDTIAAANWALGSAIAGLAIILLAPISGLSPTELTLLVVPALGAALIGHFDSVPLALLGAFVIGIGESEVGLVTSAPGWSEAAPLIIIVVLLMVRGHDRHDRSEVVQRLASVGSGRIGPAAGVAALAAAVLMLVVSVSWLSALTATVVLGVGLLSVVVVTGYAGQLSLAQYGLAGVSAFMTALLATRFGLSIWAAMAVAVVVTVLLGIVVAIPALRTRGPTLAIATLSLVVVIEDLLLTNPTTAGWMAGGAMPPLAIGGLSFNPQEHPRSFALLALAVFALAAVAVTNLRRSSVGRKLLAIRANPQAAASLGVSPTLMKTYAFAFAGVIAAVCGALTESQMSYPDFSLFSTQSSINLVLQATIGGVGWIAGALTGGVAAAGGLASKALGLVVSPSNWLDVITAAALLLVIMQSPDGAVPMQARQLQGLSSGLKFLFTRSGLGRIGERLAGAKAREDPFARSVRRGITAADRRRPARLEVEGLTVIFGTVRALDGVTLKVSPGEIVGLIGPNGAGKSTFIDATCGSLEPAAGTVRLDGSLIDGTSASHRARLGLIRSFQHLELFEDMSVGENLLAACERPSWERALLDPLWPGGARATEAARLAAEEFDLWDVLTATPRTLDHGRRRLLAIARAFAADPAVVLLDEPAAGLDAGERAELGVLLRKVAKEWNIGVLLVEHDVNLVFGMCDRVVALVNGRVVAEGRPHEVRHDKTVLEAYLGARSGRELATGGPLRPMPGTSVTASEATSQAENMIEVTKTLGRLPDVSADMVVRTKDLCVGYSGVSVAKGINVEVRKGEVVALLGRNGAGKTTILHTLAGILPALSGTVELHGERPAGTFHRRVRTGLALVTEERAVIRRLTVMENLRLSRSTPDLVLDIFPELRALRHQHVGLLSGGEQQMLALGKLMASSPSILLIDELSFGLGPMIVDRLLEAVRQAADAGAGVLLVEQQPTTALAVADRGYVLTGGEIRLSGSGPDMLRRLDEIEAMYLAA
jgi:ABC-type branched-subunit amino acid transport system ATPase component/ABC-type branched-subunit amino acid transport system permease subunit